MSDDDTASDISTAFARDEDGNITIEKVADDEEAVRAERQQRRSAAEQPIDSASSRKLQQQRDAPVELTTKSYDVDEDSDTPDPDNIKDRWMWLFEKYSHDNPMLGRFQLHALLGQILKDMYVTVDANRIDLRIHGFYFAPSGTGKSAGLELYYDIKDRIEDELDIEIIRKGTFTDAAAVGSINQNYFNKLTTRLQSDKENPEGIETIDDAREEAKEEGFLKGDGLLVSDEGSQFIKSDAEYEAGKTEHMQQAMNSIHGGGNTITKDLKSIELKCESEKSAMMVSYLPKDLDEHIQTTGLFQRTLVYIKVYNKQDWKNNYLARIGRIDEEPDPTDHDAVMSRFVEDLKEIRDRYEGQDRIPWSEGAKSMVKELIMGMLADTDSLGEHESEHLRSYISRYLNHSLVLATHHCCMRHGDEVTEDDVEYAKQMMYKIFERLQRFMFEQVDNEETTNKKDKVWSFVQNKWRNKYDSKKAANTDDAVHLEGSSIEGDDRERIYVHKDKLFTILRQEGDFKLPRQTFNEYLKEWEEQDRVDWKRGGGAGNKSRISVTLDRAASA